jgi:hypothetical protein
VLDNPALFYSLSGLGLREDLALVKVTLLYADHVKFCSVGASILSGIAGFQEASTEEQAKLVVKFLSDLQPSVSPQEIRFFETMVGLRATRRRDAEDCPPRLPPIATLEPASRNVHGNPGS